MGNKDGNGAAGGMARAAAAAYNIARGAAVGGLKGAAAGAAKSFLPEIMKAGVAIISVFVVLPLLIFAAIPNFLFGYDSALADDIIELTEMARMIDAAYKDVQNFTQEEVDRIIGEVVGMHTTEDGPQFDGLAVNQDTDNTNIFWFIAITSVVHQQDLFTMDEGSIRALTIRKIIFSAAIFTTVDGEGETAEVTRMLQIDIEDLDPEALMDELGFTDEERNWARVLHSTLAEEQHTAVEDGDGPGALGTNFGHIVFAHVSTPVVYYNQFDSRWGDLPYGRSGTIGTSGCGPASLAMVVATLADPGITPVEVAQWAVANGYRVEGSGSKRALIPDGGRHYGLQVESIGRDAERLVEALKEGKLVIAIMNEGHFTRRGHFLVLRGVTGDGKILVADSGSYRRTNMEWDLRIIFGEASRNTHSGGPFWVFSA